MRADIVIFDKSELVKIFDPLIKRWDFKLSFYNEEDKKIMLATDYLKILIIEEYRPPKIFMVRLYDGNEFYLGLDVLYKYKKFGYSLEEDSFMSLEKLKSVTDFLTKNYPELLSGDERIKKELLKFSKK